MNKFLPYILILVIIIADQVSKLLILRLGFESACNTGFAFGILSSGLFSSNGLSLLIAGLVIIVCGFFLVKEKTVLISACLALIVSGGLSNVIDRLARHCVVDFINFGFWPAFNLADAAVTAGAVLVIYAFLFKREEPAHL